MPVPLPALPVRQHSVEIHGPFVVCVTCGAYAAQRRHHLALACRQLAPKGASAADDSKRKRRDRILSGRPPRTCKPLQADAALAAVQSPAPPAAAPFAEVGVAAALDSLAAAIAVLQQRGGEGMSIYSQAASCCLPTFT